MGAQSNISTAAKGDGPDSLMLMYFSGVYQQNVQITASPLLYHALSHA